MFDDFWRGLSDTFNGWFNPGPQQVGGPGQGMAEAPGGGYQSTSSPDSGGSSGAGDLFKTIGGAIAPGLGMLATSAVANKAFPSSPGRVIQLPGSPGAPGGDPRSAEGRAAEEIRLQNAGAASESLAKARAGELDPDVEYKLRKRVRSADAARGMLETGGSGGRELSAVQDEVQRVINREAGNVGTFTGGYQPQQLPGAASPGQGMYIPGQENPWAKLTTAALAPGIGQATKDLYKWFI